MQKFLKPEKKAPLCKLYGRVQRMETTKTRSYLVHSGKGSTEKLDVITVDKPIYNGRVIPHFRRVNEANRPKR